MNKKRPILITAGGTGGHVYPGLAVARFLQSQGHRIIWMGTKKGLEAKVIPEAGIEIAWLRVTGIRKKGIFTLLKAPFLLLTALVQSIGIMLKYKPVVVLGMGGFVAGPGGLVAALMLKPLIIHEQNAIAGLTNKLLSRLSRKTLQGFPNTFTGKNVLTVGNPVRKAIANLAAPEVRFLNREGKIRLLIIGGSLGAVALNETVPEALALFTEAERPEVYHQSGNNNLETAKEAYQTHHVQAKIVPYIKDMAETYAWADLIICRSGALTIAEVAAAGLAAILIPYPYAVDDHQTANGKYLSDNEAAILMPQATITAESLAKQLKSLCNDRERLLQMSMKSRQLAKINATETVAKLCTQYL